MQKKNLFKDSMIVGFALFAMFFGAGNIIFPPSIGLGAGKSWLTGFFFYYMADIGLALVAIYALVKTDKIDKPEGLMERLGHIPGLLMMGAAIICIGPLLAIPRTATVSFGMAALPMLGGGGPEDHAIAAFIFIIAYFAAVYAMAIKETALVDIVGKYLTPALVIGLAAMILKGAVSPIGDINPVNRIGDGLIWKSVMDGYMTLDVLAALVFGLIVVNSLKARGYTGDKEKFKSVMSAGLIAGGVLMFIYGGLCYLGATASMGDYPMDGDQAQFVVVLAKNLFGTAGGYLLGVTVLLACLTTAIALVGAVSTFFATISKGRIKYEHTVLVTCLFSIVVANYGLATILKISVPILMIVYPAALVVIILSLFDSYIKNDNIFKGAALAALIVSVFEVIVVGNLEPTSSVVTNFKYLPLAEHGFAWLVPAAIGIIIGAFIPSKGKNKEKVSK